MSRNGFDPVAVLKQVDGMSVQQLLQQSAHTAKVLKNDPRNFPAHYTLAIMYRNLKEYLKALSHFKKAHKLEPKVAIVLELLSKLLTKDMGKHQQALKYLQKWQLLQNGEKGSAVILALIAECQIELGKADAALNSLERAKRINPDEQKVYLVSSKIYGAVGNFDAAAEHAKKAFEINPNETAAIALSRFPNFGGDQDTIASIEEIAGRTEKPEVAANLFGAIAQEFERVGDHQKAFLYVEKSNELPRKRLNREKELVKFRNLRATFTKSFLSEVNGLGHETNQLIFVVGMPRSGTTLTESILAGHPRITDKGEQTYLISYMLTAGIDREVNPLLERKLPTFQSHFVSAPDEYFRIMGTKYLKELAFDQKSRNMQVDKLPHNFMSVGLISTIFPNAKIIHCRRHPIDCALSCYKQSFFDFHAYATDLEFLGLYYRQYWELMKHWREVLPGKMFEICYEDTVANKELVARNLINHIGLEWDDRCLDHTASKTTVSTASQWQVRQPIYTTSVAKWKHYEKQLQPMIKNMGSCVEEYEAELAAMSG